MTEHYLDRLARTINENWDQPALIDFYLTEDGTSQNISRGNHYTYGEMYQEILHVCDIFRSLGLQKGDHIAICGANSSHWAIAYLAIAAYQGVAVTILHSQSAEDIASQLCFSDAKALFTDADLWKECKDQSLPLIEHVISLENWSVVRGGKVEIPNRKSLITNHQVSFVHGSLDDLAMICFTSGTTGISKGVVFSNQGVASNILCAAQSFPSNYNKRVLVLMPMDHFLSLGTLLGALETQCELFIYKSEIRIDAFVRTIQITQPYILPAVPQFANFFLSENYKNALNDIVQSLEYLVVTGASLQTPIAAQLLKKRFPITMGYGMTECPIISSSLPTNYRLEAAGKACAVMTVNIAPNGEILVKGENVMLGYYKDPEATACKIDKDGWLHTGDKGHLDEDGYLYVEGRLEQDMIVLPNGENIHPEDIEHKINALPEVKESIVLARDGKLVAIVVAQITNDQSPMTNTDLRRMILRKVNPELPLYSQLYDVEITDTPLQKTEKQTIKRYLYM